MMYHAKEPKKLCSSKDQAYWESFDMQMSHVTRKSVFRVSDQQKLKPACSADGIS